MTLKTLLCYVDTVCGHELLKNYRRDRITHSALGGCFPVLLNATSLCKREQYPPPQSPECVHPHCVLSQDTAAPRGPEGANSNKCSCPTTKDCNILTGVLSSDCSDLCTPHHGKTEFFLLTFKFREIVYFRCHFCVCIVSMPMSAQ